MSTPNVPLFPSTYNKSLIYILLLVMIQHSNQQINYKSTTNSPIETHYRHGKIIRETTETQRGDITTKVTKNYGSLRKTTDPPNGLRPTDIITELARDKSKGIHRILPKKQEVTHGSFYERITENPNKHLSTETHKTHVTEITEKPQIIPKNIQTTDKPDNPVRIPNITSENRHVTKVIEGTSKSSENTIKLNGSLYELSESTTKINQLETLKDSASKDVEGSVIKDSERNAIKDTERSTHKDAKRSSSRDIRRSTSKEIRRSTSKDLRKSTSRDIRRSRSKDAKKDIKRSTSNDVKRSMSEDDERSTSKDVKRSTSKDVERSTSEDDERSKSEDDERSTFKDDERSTSKDVKRSTSKDMKRSTSKDVKRSMSKDVKRSMSKDVKRSTSKDMKRSTSKDMKRSTSKDVKRSTSRDVKRITLKQRNMSEDAERGMSKESERSTSKDPESGMSKGSERSISKDAERITSKDAERDTSKGSERSISRDAERDTSKGSERSISKDTKRNTSKDAERDTSNGSERSISRDAERDMSKGSERIISKDVERSTSKDAEKDTSEGSERSTSKDAEKDTSKGSERSTSKDVERSTLKASERSMSRDIERSTLKASGRSMSRDIERSRSKRDDPRNFPEENQKIWSTTPSSISEFPSSFTESRIYPVDDDSEINDSVQKILQKYSTSQSPRYLIADKSEETNPDIPEKDIKRLSQEEIKRLSQKELFHSSIRNRRYNSNSRSISKSYGKNLSRRLRKREEKPERTIDGSKKELHELTERNVEDLLEQKVKPDVSGQKVIEDLLGQNRTQGISESLLKDVERSTSKDAERITSKDAESTLKDVERRVPSSSKHEDGTLLSQNPKQDSSTSIPIEKLLTPNPVEGISGRKEMDPEIIQGVTETILHPEGIEELSSRKSTNVLSTPDPLEELLTLNRFDEISTPIQAEELSTPIQLEELPTPNSIGDLSTQRAENLPTQRVEDLSKQRAENLSTQRVEDLSTQKVEDLSIQRAEDLSAQRTEDLSAQRSEDLSAQRTEDLSAQRTEDLSDQRTEDLSTQRVENLSTQRVEDLSTQRVEDLSTQRAEDLSTQRVEDLSTQRVEDLSTQKVENLSTQDLTDDILIQKSSPSTQITSNEEAPSDIEDNLEFLSSSTQNRDEDYPIFKLLSIEESHHRSGGPANFDDEFSGDYDLKSSDIPTEEHSRQKEQVLKRRRRVLEKEDSKSGSNRNLRRDGSVLRNKRDRRRIIQGRYLESSGMSEDLDGNESGRRRKDLGRGEYLEDAKDLRNLSRNVSEDEEKDSVGTKNFGRDSTGKGKPKDVPQSVHQSVPQSVPQSVLQSFGKVEKLATDTITEYNEFMEVELKDIKKDVEFIERKVKGVEKEERFIEGEFQDVKKEFLKGNRPFGQKIVEGLLEFTTISSDDNKKETTKIFGEIKPRETTTDKPEPGCEDIKQEEITYGVLHKEVNNSISKQNNETEFARIITKDTKDNSKKNKTIISYGKVLINKQLSNCTNKLIKDVNKNIFGVVHKERADDDEKKVDTTKNNGYTKIYGGLLTKKTDKKKQNNQDETIRYDTRQNKKENITTYGIIKENIYTAPVGKINENLHENPTDTFGIIMNVTNDMNTTENITKHIRKHEKNTYYGIIKNTHKNTGIKNCTGTTLKKNKHTQIRNQHKHYEMTANQESLHWMLKYKEAKKNHNINFERLKALPGKSKHPHKSDEVDHFFHNSNRNKKGQESLKTGDRPENVPLKVFLQNEHSKLQENRNDNLQGNEDKSFRKNGDANLQGNEDENLQGNEDKSLRKNGDANLQENEDENLRENGDTNLQGTEDENLRKNGDANLQGNEDRNLENNGDVRENGTSKPSEYGFQSFQTDESRKLGGGGRSLNSSEDHQHHLSVLGKSNTSVDCQNTSVVSGELSASKDSNSDGQNTSLVSGVSHASKDSNSDGQNASLVSGVSNASKDSKSNGQSKLSVTELSNASKEAQNTSELSDTSKDSDRKNQNTSAVPGVSDTSKDSDRNTQNTSTVPGVSDTSKDSVRDSQNTSIVSGMSDTSKDSNRNSQNTSTVPGVPDISKDSVRDSQNTSTVLGVSDTSKDSNKNSQNTSIVPGMSDTSKDSVRDSQNISIVSGVSDTDVDSQNNSPDVSNASKDSSDTSSVLRVSNTSKGSSDTSSVLRVSNTSKGSEVSNISKDSEVSNTSKSSEVSNTSKGSEVSNTSKDSNSDAQSNSEVVKSSNTSINCQNSPVFGLSNAFKGSNPDSNGNSPGTEGPNASNGCQNTLPVSGVSENDYNSSGQNSQGSIDSLGKNPPDSDGLDVGSIPGYQKDPKSRNQEVIDDVRPLDVLHPVILTHGHKKFQFSQRNRGKKPNPKLGPGLNTQKDGGNPKTFGYEHGVGQNRKEKVFESRNGYKDQNGRIGLKHNEDQNGGEVSFKQNGGILKDKGRKSEDIQGNEGIESFNSTERENSQVSLENSGIKEKSMRIDTTLDDSMRINTTLDHSMRINTTLDHSMSNDTSRDNSTSTESSKSRQYKKPFLYEDKHDIRLNKKPYNRTEKCGCVLFRNVKKFSKNKGLFRVLNLHVHHKIEEETMSFRRNYTGSFLPPIPIVEKNNVKKNITPELTNETIDLFVVPLATNIKPKRSKQMNGTRKDFQSSYKRKLNSSSRLIENLPKVPIRLPGGDNSKRTVVSLLGLFELSTKYGDRPEGRSELAAAHLAVKHINTKKLLPGYTLELLTNDTQCDPGVGVDRFFHALYTQKSTRMVMLLGSACSEVTESLAKVVPYWNIVQVSFGSTSPALSDRQEFPLFYRTVAPDSSHNPARIAFVRRFGWDTVAAFSQNGDAYSLALNELVTELEQANITCTTTITFAETDLKEQLRILRDHDTRIIIGSFSNEVAPKIFCEAYQLGMFGADYAWILQGNGANTWWMNSTECPRHQLIAAVEGLILVSSHNSIVGKQPSLSGLTNEMFASELEMQAVQVSKYAPQTYDAVWAIALALSGAENIWRRANNTTVGHFDYTRRDMATEFLTQLGRLNFLGISGPVSFSGADRVGTSAFHQVQDEVVRTVALYYPSSSLLDFECPGCEPLRWQGGQVPIAKRVFKFRVITIAPAAFLVISSLAVVGIMLALAFLSFNLHFRRLKSIKLSSPRLNNMTVVGCILVYAAVILLGLDHATLRVAEHFATVCTARVYLLSAGFSLAFGSMFTKTYRVHRIFIRSRSGVVKDKLLQDTQLISLICVLLLIDVFIVTLWVIIDPMQRHLRNLTLEISTTDRSVVYQPQVEVCRSQNINGWLGALYVYKGLLLLVGVYMAWETRHVKIPALNDSQYIGMSVYSVVITSGIVVVLANLMSDKATLSFVTITTFILISTTTTLCLLFLPKVHAILKKADNCDPVIQSMGLKLECNTRRFVTDDRRELQYRVEIQNKVYRREVAALDLEIGRLEKQLLEMNSVSASSSTSSMTKKHLAEMALDESIRRESHPRTPSIGGGLPLLLLSVLPPVIPRASWPSAVQELPMRRNVTFSSEPKLDDQHIKNRREPMIDLYNLCLRPERFNEKLTVIGRLKNLFGSRPSIRKDRASSYAGHSSVGIASALRVHMGYIAGLVPGSTSKDQASSCNTSSTAINKLDGLYSRRQSFARQGGSGPIISITSDADDEDDQDEQKRKFSLAFCLKRDEMTDGTKVNFALPLQKRKSMTHQNSQPVLSFRERARGSPRFPHKIMPTCSLTALEDKRKLSCVSTNSQPSRRSSQQPLTLKNSTRRKTLEPMGPKWKSMEDASTTVLPGSRRGSGVLAISCLPSSAQPTNTRASSYSPNCDVWSTAEFGIPLSELATKNQQ